MTYLSSGKFTVRTVRNFIPDGHVNEEAWSGAELKVMVLLKEVNSSDSGWNLRSLYERRDISRKAVPGLHLFGGHMESCMDSRNIKRLNGDMPRSRKRLTRFSKGLFCQCEEDRWWLAGKPYQYRVPHAGDRRTSS